MDSPFTRLVVSIDFRLANWSFFPPVPGHPWMDSTFKMFTAFAPLRGKLLECRSCRPSDGWAETRPTQGVDCALNFHFHMLLPDCPHLFAFITQHCVSDHTCHVKSPGHKQNQHVLCAGKWVFLAWNDEYCQTQLFYNIFGEDILLVLPS